MNFRDAVESVLRKYATFSGRATRAEYWWFYLFTFLLGLVTNVIDSALHSGALGGLVNLALFLPSLAVAVRRLHDSDRSGWWLLAPVGVAIAGVVALIAGIGTGFAAAFNESGHSDGIAGAAIGLFLLGLGLILVAAVVSIVLMCLPSTPGANKYGPHPDDTQAPAGYGVGYGSGQDLYGTQSGYAAPVAPPVGYGQPTPDVTAPNYNPGNDANHGSGQVPGGYPAPEAPGQR